MNLRKHKSAAIREPVKLALTYNELGVLEMEGECRAHDAIQVLLVALAMMLVDNMNSDACFKQLCAEAARLLTVEMESFYEEANHNDAKKN